MTEIIPLQIKLTSNPTFVAEIELTLEGQPKLFLLDTGAATSSLALDIQTKDFPVVEN